MTNIDPQPDAGPVEVLRTQALDAVITKMSVQRPYAHESWAAFVMVARFDGTRLSRLDAATYDATGAPHEAVVARRLLREPLERLSVVMEGPAGQLPIAMVFTVRAADRAFVFEQAYAGDLRVEAWDVDAHGLAAVADAVSPLKS